MLLDSLVEAGSFTSNLQILEIHIQYEDEQSEMDQLCSAIQALVIHCSDHLQIFIFNPLIDPIQRYDSEISGIDVELWDRIDTLLTSPQFASLHKVTITQKDIHPEGLTFQTDLLPKLYKCGILAVLNQI
ncbi:hypothetical protein QCA50_007391 [Cerrena zonata]|uniref:Uncharacterized protein n=1 Tax=Cerrena zonata TaxID=2478898 RepID=A0AAW0GDZ3_9APHY